MVALFTLAAFILIGCSNKKNDGIVIYVDGGGGNGNFNTTASLEKTPENPYPYNTLESLANKYMKIHPDVKIVINKNSLNGDRESIVSLLSAEEAPDLLYMISPDELTDANNDWIVDLTSYLEEPNPYCLENEAGYVKWKDLYNEKELLATQAANGNYYKACLEKIPIGIIYNKSLFEAANIAEVPDTFGQLLDVQKQINDETGKIPYFPIYTWYDIVLEVSLFSNLFDQYDVIKQDGFISAEEITRAYTKGEWGISSDSMTEAEKMYKEYFKLMKEKTQYYPEAWESYEPLEEFLKGNVAMIEATGGYMAQIANDQTKDFEVGVFGFPTLSEEDSEHGGNGVYRGTAGLTTGYYVTNSAVRDGQETVDASVDFLKFLTAPSNNTRLVNDLGLGLPLSPGAEINELFQPLVDIYLQDSSDPNRYDWNSFCSWNDFGKQYYDTFITTVQAYQKGKIDIDEALDTMTVATDKAMESTMVTNGWTEDMWGE
jgi:ABC-type glycerol-3-phosphate transport system substrate-binding protein